LAFPGGDWQAASPEPQNVDSVSRDRWAPVPFKSRCGADGVKSVSYDLDELLRHAEAAQ
jgi:hypothetical protein